MSKEIEVVSKNTAYKGFFTVDKFEFRHSKHEGGMSGVITREVFQRGHAAAVLAYDRKSDSVLLIEEFRPGFAAAGFQADQCWSYGPIAGMIDEGETPNEAAMRECVEEAGFDISGTTLLGPLVVLPSPGGCSETLHLFICETDLSKVGGIHGAPDEGENILPVVMSRSDAMDFLMSGKPLVGNTATLLLWLDRLIATEVIKVGE